jgi:hypothetical protein
MSNELLPSHTFHSTTLATALTELESYGNQISDDHKLALSGLCELASLMLAGNLDQRVRFALPCGMGKTTCVRAILRTTHQLGLRHRIVVASSKVEELCALKRRLIAEDGIPESLIGLQHSYPCCPKRAKAGQSGFASEPAANADAQFLLVTHANVQSPARAWMDRCDLVLFDESLVVGQAHCLPLVRDLKSQSVFTELLSLEGHAKTTDPSLEPAAVTTRLLFDQLKRAISEVLDCNVGVVQANCVDVTRVQEARTALAHVPESFPLIRQLLDWAESATELRVYGNAEDRVTLLTYSVTVPDRLQRVIVLDASDPIREIVHHDHRMARAEDVLPSLARFKSLPGGLASIKYHSNVQVYFACDGGGRSTLTSSLRKDSDPKMLKKVAQLVASKPQESFLVFTHKTRERDADFARRILQALMEEDVDPEATVPSAVPGMPEVPRVAITTWGRETGTNEFSTYANVVLLGVMRKPVEAVAGTYLGQVDDLRSPRMKYVVKQLTDSETRQSIYQAVNRGSMRRVQVVDGITQSYPCNIYVWHWDADLESQLGLVLPGCPKWTEWREPWEKTRESDVAMRIHAALARLEESGITKISCQALKKLVAPLVGETMFRNARRTAIEQDGRWIKNKSSLELGFSI